MSRSHKAPVLLLRSLGGKSTWKRAGSWGHVGLLRPPRQRLLPITVARAPGSPLVLLGSRGRVKPRLYLAFPVGMLELGAQHPPCSSGCWGGRIDPSPGACTHGLAAPESLLLLVGVFPVASCRGGAFAGEMSGMPRAAAGKGPWRAPWPPVSLSRPGEPVSKQTVCGASCELLALVPAPGKPLPWKTWSLGAWRGNPGVQSSRNRLVGLDGRCEEVTRTGLRSSRAGIPQDAHLWGRNPYSCVVLSSGSSSG